MSRACQRGAEGEWGGGVGGARCVQAVATARSLHLLRVLATPSATGSALPLGVFG